MQVARRGCATSTPFRMPARIRKQPLLLAPLALAGCEAQEDPAGALRPDEIQAINDAAEMLRPNSVSAAALAADNQAPARSADNQMDRP